MRHYYVAFLVTEFVRHLNGRNQSTVVLDAIMTLVCYLGSDLTVTSKQYHNQVAVSGNKAPAISKKQYILRKFQLLK